MAYNEGFMTLDNVQKKSNFHNILIGLNLPVMTTYLLFPTVGKMWETMSIKKGETHEKENYQF